MKHALLAFLFTLSLHAQRSPLAGTWRLTGADEIRPDGTIVEPYGASAEGLLIVDDSGRYSLQIFRPDRQRFAAGDKQKGTPAEYEAAVKGMSSHIGVCSIENGLLLFRIDRASYPNWEGTTQRRAYQLKGDELSYEIPPSATGNGTISRSRWKRVKS